MQRSHKPSMMCWNSVPSGFVLYQDTTATEEHLDWETAFCIWKIPWGVICHWGSFPLRSATPELCPSCPHFSALECWPSIAMEFTCYQSLKEEKNKPNKTIPHWYEESGKVHNKDVTKMDATWCKHLAFHCRPSTPKRLTTLYLFWTACLSSTGWARMTRKRLRFSVIYSEMHVGQWAHPSKACELLGGTIALKL